MSATISSDFSTVLIDQWTKTLNLIADIFNIPTVLIMKLDGDRIKVFAKNNAPQNPYDIGGSEVFENSGLYCEHVIKNQKLLEVKNALKDPDWDNNPDIKLNMIYYLGVPINYSNGEPFGTICVLDDHEREYQDKYRELLLQIKNDLEGQMKSFDLQQQLFEKQSLNYVENVICGISHELNTPTGISITALSTLSNTLNEFAENVHQQQLTKRQFSDFEQKAVSCLELLRSSLDKTSVLIGRLKDISTQFSSDIRVIRLDHFLTELVNTSTNIYQDKADISLTVAEGTSLSTIPHLLHNVISSLVENAITHAFNGMSKNHINIVVQEAESGVVMYFSDNGKGIDQSIERDVFTPFFTRKRFSGHIGLGLTVVKKIIVMQLKGSISLIKSDKGASFEIQLPNLN